MVQIVCSTLTFGHISKCLGRLVNWLELEQNHLSLCFLGCLIRCYRYYQLV